MSPKHISYIAGICLLLIMATQAYLVYDYYQTTRAGLVRESDAILREEFQLAGLDKKVWQYFTVVPDFKSVGVRDNARSFDWPVIIRAVNTVDAMTATIEPVDWPILMKITDRILKEVKTVNRVCYDMSPKPNATIEWE